MRIHTVKKGESVAELAREYEISEELLRAYNDLPEGEGAIGEELCILRPTRCYAMRKFDSPESLANRFSTSKSELLRINPHLTDGRGENGRAVALKIPERTLGGAVSLGYIYDGCSERDLRRALPHLSYAVICAGVCEEKRTGIAFSIEGIKRILSESGVPYLLRFHDRSEGRAASNPTEFADGIVRTVLSEGAMGLVLPCEGRLGDEMKETLPILSKLAKENGLFLITETDEETREEIYEHSGASIFCYDELTNETPLPYSDGARRAVLDFSAARGNGLGFLELPCLARVGDDFLSKKDALNIARRSGAEIKSSPDTMISSFQSKGKEYRFQSLENIKSHLSLIKEAGLSGVCLDVARTPTNTLMTYTSLFKNRGALPLSSGGCKRE